ncbi:MAG: right-handed parallel beta-helix repeat-containing protein [Candidatus Thermoplasmatota archaeon]|nr:right-handed parallel beta-helix repeat-containing protein [Candidatus Thermoplasmatota archaeon]
MGDLTLMFVLVLFLPYGFMGASSSENDLILCKGLMFDGVEWSGDTDHIIGSGSSCDPYLISNLGFDLRSGTGIKIMNSSKHIVIHHVGLYYGNGSTAIKLLNSSNIVIRNVLSFRCWMGLEIGDSTDLTIENATIYGGYNGITIHRSSNLEFIGCSSTYNNANGMIVNDSERIRISHCLLEVNSPRLGSDQGLLIHNSSFIEIDRTAVMMNYGTGILITGEEGSASDGIVMKNCTIDNNVDGIRCEGGSLSIFDTTFSSNTHGIIMFDSTGSTIDGCLFKDNHRALSLYDSERTMITSSKFQSNDGSISLKDSINNTIASNEFRNDTDHSIIIGRYGPERDASSQNIIMDNHFIDHRGLRDCTLDMGCDNYWNGPDKGNRWSDHLGPDNDGNGFVDSPRMIPGLAGSSDTLPLASLYPEENERDMEGPSIDLIFLFSSITIAFSLLSLIIVSLRWRGRSSRDT